MPTAETVKNPKSLPAPRREPAERVASFKPVVWPREEEDGRDRELDGDRARRVPPLGSRCRQSWSRRKTPACAAAAVRDSTTRRRDGHATDHNAENVKAHASRGLSVVLRAAGLIPAVLAARCEDGRDQPGRSQIHGCFFGGVPGAGNLGGVMPPVFMICFVPPRTPSASADPSARPSDSPASCSSLKNFGISAAQLACRRLPSPASAAPCSSFTFLSGGMIATHFTHMIPAGVWKNWLISPTLSVNSTFSTSSSLPSVSS